MRIEMALNSKELKAITDLLEGKMHNLTVTELAELLAYLRSK